MIFLDRPIGPIEGLQIYRDHADPNQFYYVPERPRLARNEGDEPEFIFLKYARDITDNPLYTPEQKKDIGGGLLAFTVDLSVEEEVLRTVKSQLVQYAGGGAVALSPIPVEDGTVRLSMISNDPKREGAPAPAPDGGLRIYEETWGATKPSLYGNNRATFGITMNHEAASLLEAALKAGISYIGVVYDLQFLGMRPAYHVKVTADYKRIYDHFEGELGAAGQIGPVVLKADLAAAYQRLEDEGTIKVEVTTFTDKTDIVAEAKAAADWARQQITSELFKTSLQPPSFMTRASKSPLDMLTDILSKQLGGKDTRNTVQSKTPAPVAPGSSKQTKSEAEVKGDTKDLKGGDHVKTPPKDPANSEKGDKDDKTAPKKEADKPTPDKGKGDDQTPASSGSQTPSISIGLKLRYYRQEELKKRTFEFTRQGAEKRTIAPQGLFTTMIDGRLLADRIVEVNLDDDFFKRLVLETRPAVNWQHEGIELMAVSVDYPGRRADTEQPIHSDGFTFTESAASPRIFEVFLNKQKNMWYRYKADVHFKADSPWLGKDAVLHGTWQDDSARPLIINALDMVGLMSIQIVADSTIDFAQVKQVNAELEYHDPDAGWKVGDTFVLDAETRTRTWKLRLSNRARRGYRYRLEYFLDNNVRVKTDFVEADDPTLVISSPFHNKRRIRLVPRIKAEDIIEAVVDVEYEESAQGYRRDFQHVFTPDAMGSASVQIDTLAEDPPAFTYRLTVVRNDGSLFESGDRESTSSVILVDAGDVQAKKVRARLLGDPADFADFYAIELEVKGPDGSIDSEYFVPADLAGPGKQRVLWLSPDEDDNLSYEWRRLQHKKDGTVAESAWVSAGDDELLVSVR